VKTSTYPESCRVDKVFLTGLQKTHEMRVNGQKKTLSKNLSINKKLVNLVKTLSCLTRYFPEEVRGVRPKTCQLVILSCLSAKTCQRVRFS